MPKNCNDCKKNVQQLLLLPSVVELRKTETEEDADGS